MHSFDQSSRVAETAAEVTILWGSNIVFVTHLVPLRSFVVGEGTRDAPVDFQMPKERLGQSRLELLVKSETGVSLQIPAQAQGEVRRLGEAPEPLLPGAKATAPPSTLSLELGVRARIELGDFSFRVALVEAAPASPRSLIGDTEGRVVGYYGASFLGIGALIAAAAFFVPPMGLSDDEEMDRDRVYLLQAYLEAATEREREQKQDQAEEQKAQHESGGEGERAQGAEGQMGKPLSKQTGQRAGVKGPEDNPDPHLARARALEAAQTFGMLSVLTGDPAAPTLPWGRDTSLGNDALSAQGGIWGDEIGETFGSGLGLSGTGIGAGGPGKGMGLGNIGFGLGASLGNDSGFGRGPGRLLGTRVSKAPSVRMAEDTTLSGHLPREVVQRIVRQNYGRFRLCYQTGLVRNPNLAGRVAVRFVIGRDGAVSNVARGSSDLPDSSVVSCVVSAFYGLSFPVPEDGIVSVVYPIMFSPG